MLQAALAAGTARPARRCSSCSPGGCPRGGATAWSPASAARSTRSRRSGSTTRSWRSLEGVVDEPTLEWLAGYRFTGDIWGYAEGEVYFPHSPLLVVESTFAEAVVLETLLLSIYNHDRAVASAASRMTCAAGDRPCIEMGSRRTHEEAAVAAARAAYVAGFASTSNLAARQRYGVPTAGTSAHSFTLLHDSEADAFRAQVDVARRAAPPCSSTPTTSPRRCGSASRWPDRGSARSGSTPATSARSPTQVRDQLDSLGATRHPDRRDQRPRRVRHRRAGRRARRRLRRGHPAGDRQRAPDVRASSTSSSPARARSASSSRSPRRASTRSRSAGASGRCGGVRPTGVAEAEVVGIGDAARRRRRRPPAAGARSCATARSSAGSRCEAARARHLGGPRRAAAGCPAAVAGASPSSRPSLRGVSA